MMLNIGAVAVAGLCVYGLFTYLEGKWENEYYETEATDLDEISEIGKDLTDFKDVKNNLND
jgi:hypothetical protein